jgi:glycosyltransferase involved in cell wall biosynthesis
MNKAVKVSVIIPVFNVEKYLKECLESAANQTLKEIEIICINDGSTDASLEILRECAQKDERIKIIDQKNQGPASARNKGLSKARGEYIGFVDSDDYIEENYYETLYQQAKEQDADIAMAPTSVLLFSNQAYQRTNSQKLIHHKLNGGSLDKYFDFYDVWHSIYRATLINDNKIKFDEAAFYGEVLVFALKAKYYSKKTIPVIDALYCYRKEIDGQLTKTLDFKKCANIIECADNIFTFINSVPLDKKDYLNIFSIYLLQLYDAFRETLQNGSLTEQEREKFFYAICDEFKKCAYPIELKKYLPHPSFKYLDERNIKSFLKFCLNPSRVKRAANNFSVVSENYLQIKTKDFFGLNENIYMSAIRILSILNRYIPSLLSAADIDCGSGLWLKAWKDTKANQMKFPLFLLGFTNKISNVKKLFFDRKFIKEIDIEKSSLMDISDRFDIALSLGYAKRLDDKKAKRHINFLVGLSDIVLFSPDAPSDKTDDSFGRHPAYWSNFFQECGYVCFDIFRLKTWKDPWIAWQYRQNIMLYVKSTKADALIKQGLVPVENPSSFYALDIASKKLRKYRKRYQSLLFLISLFFIVIILLASAIASISVFYVSLALIAVISLFFFLGRRSGGGDKQ